MIVNYGEGLKTVTHTHTHTHPRLNERSKFSRKILHSNELWINFNLLMIHHQSASLRYQKSIINLNLETWVGRSAN